MRHPVSEQIMLDQELCQWLIEFSEQARWIVAPSREYVEPLIIEYAAVRRSRDNMTIRLEPVDHVASGYWHSESRLTRSLNTAVSNLRAVILDG